MPRFTTDDEMVGQRVWIYSSHGEGEPALVLAVSTRNANIRVLADDGEVMIGNQWEPMD